MFKNNTYFIKLFIASMGDLTKPGPSFIIIWEASNTNITILYFLELYFIICPTIEKSTNYN